MTLSKESEHERARIIREAFPNLSKALIGSNVVPTDTTAYRTPELKQLDGLNTQLHSSKVSTKPERAGINAEAVNGITSWLTGSNRAGNTFTTKLDLDEYLSGSGYTLDEKGRITESLTTATYPIRPIRRALVIPGGQLTTPIRQFMNYERTEQGNDSVNFHTISAATFGAITEGNTPTEDSITITAVQASPTTRGSFVKVKYSVLESNAFPIVEALSDLAMRAAVDGENTEVLDTVAAAATNNTNQWINGNTGAVITAGTGTSGNDDIASMTLALAGLSAAKNALDVQGYSNYGGYVFAVHPRNFNELIISSGLTNLTQFGVPGITTSGALSQLLGVTMVPADQVAAQNNTTNDTYQNIMFVPQQAFGLASAREVTIKAEEHSELQQLYWTATHRIAAKVLDNKAWCRVSCAQ